MRTSVEIADPLMKAVRETMRRRGVTFRELVEEGLRRIVSEPEARGSVELEDARFRGKTGFARGVDAVNLPSVISQTLHEGRGPDA